MSHIDKQGRWHDPENRGCADRRPEKHPFDPGDIDSRLCRWCNEGLSEHLSGVSPTNSGNTGGDKRDRVSADSPSAQPSHVAGIPVKWHPDEAKIRAFVEGAKWWEWHMTGATMWQADQELAEQEAKNRYERANNQSVVQ